MTHKQKTDLMKKLSNQKVGCGGTSWPVFGGTGAKAGVQNWVTVQFLLALSAPGTCEGLGLSRVRPLFPSVYIVEHGKPL